MSDSSDGEAAAPAPAAAAHRGVYRRAQRVFLDRLADRAPLRSTRVEGAPSAGAAAAPAAPPLFGTKRQEAQIYERLRRSAANSESASLILCGHRGCGKHATLAAAVDRLDREAEQHPAISVPAPDT